MGRLLTIPLAMLLLLAGAVYWSGGGTQGRADFTFINRGDINKLDPNQMSYLQDIRIGYALWEGLYVYEGATLRPVPGVASSYDLSEDQRVYTFHLRPDAKWHDGSPVTSQDFIFAWRRMLESPGEYSYLHFKIKGAEKYSTDYDEHFASVTKHKEWEKAPVSKRGAEPVIAPLPNYDDVGVKAPDRRTLVVTLENPTAYFMDLIAFVPFFPLHEESMKPFRKLDEVTGRVSYDRKFTRPPDMVGNGPYKFVMWDFKRRLRFEASEHYWDRANVKSKSLEMVVVEDPITSFLQFDTGAVDWIAEVSSEIGPELIEKGRQDLRQFAGFGTTFLSVNCQKKFWDGRANPMSDVRVRQAMSMAIDRDLIVSTITRMGEIPAYNYTPPTIFPGWQSPKGLGFDVQRARGLMAEAGFPGGAGFPKLTYMYRTVGNVSKEMAQNLANQWKVNLGIDITLVGLEPKIASQRIKDKQYDITASSWIGDYGDPSTFTDKYTAKSENNDSDWQNEKYNQLVVAAEKVLDPQKRYRMLEEAEGLIDTELPVIPLYHITNQYMFRDNVKGINLNPRNMTMFKGVYVER